MSDLDERSNINVIHHNKRLFQRVRAKGVTTTKSNRSTLTHLRKIGLITYDRESKRYYLTEYGEILLKQAEKEDDNLLTDSLNK